MHIVPSALYQFLIGVCFLYGCNVLALQVLRDRHFLGYLVRHFVYDCRNGFQSCHERCTVSAFAKDNLEAVFINGAYTYGLQDSLLPYALGKFGKARLVKGLARVVVTRLNVCQCYRCNVLLY